MVLVCAALLKVLQWVTSPSAVVRFMAHHWLAVFAVEAETALGLLLIVGCYSRVGRLLSLFFFTAAGCISLSKALEGEISCGCFGDVQVSPWATLVIDVLVVASLLFWVPRGQASVLRSLDSRGAARIAICVALLGLPLAAAASLEHPAELDDSGFIVGDGRVVQLDPAKWVSKRFPLFGAVEIDADLTQGRWGILFHRHSCEVCQRAVKRLQGLTGRETEMHFAIVELSPRNPGQQQIPGEGLVSGKLDRTRDWLMETPTLATLEDGMVVSVATGLKALEHPWLSNNGSEGRARADR